MLEQDKKKRFHQVWSDDRGDVLLEYVLINLVIVLPLLGVGLGAFNPTGATFDVQGTMDGENYGVLGNAMVESWRRIMIGISLPIP